MTWVGIRTLLSQVLAQHSNHYAILALFETHCSEESLLCHCLLCHSRFWITWWWQTRLENHWSSRWCCTTAFVFSENCSCWLAPIGVEVQQHPGSHRFPIPALSCPFGTLTLILLGGCFFIPSFLWYLLPFQPLGHGPYHLNLDIWQAHTTR